MTQIAASISRAIEKNSIDLIVSRDVKDVFREETKKGKSNLVTTSFIAILIATLELKISSFAGIASASGILAADVTRGLACLAVVYFLVAYVLDVYLDAATWSLESKRLRISPYLVLVRHTEQMYRNCSEQLKNVEWTINHLISLEPSLRDNSISFKNFQDATGQLPAIAKYQDELLTEIRPLLQKWSETLRAFAKQRNQRRAAQAFRVWFWDVTTPALLAALAIWKTCDGLPLIVSRLLAV
ncbi:hypothetical protein XarbCFBP8142_00240 [Xanthomonas arboricola]|nr:hypothetical protein XarbCFBP8142_00240 [Xanthomonas arboricola]